MRILVACEFSGIVRDAFLARGHDAWSCDLLPSERPGPHIQGDILPELEKPWDLLIAHPPCTHLSVSGARWFKDKQKEQIAAINFFMAFTACPNIPRICIENPISIMSTKYRKPDQILQPWQYGNPFTKATCLWLKGLVPLVPTNIVEGREQQCWKEPPGINRWKNRSRTYQGIADAMAEQWSTPQGWS